jgi:hypothetical protein
LACFEPFNVSTRGRPNCGPKSLSNPARGAANQGAATADDLYDALIAGGFDFEEKSEALSKWNLAISLGKNGAFVRTPNGLWVL